MISIELKGHIRWGDADAAGRLHFPRIFEYFEDAEAELLKKAGFSSERREYDFPRVHVECQFKSVLALYAPFWLVATVGKLGRSSIRFDYRVFADEAKTVVACEGSMTVVTVKDGKAVEMPRKLRDALDGGVKC
jgi:acyl-CoA thioester hydrolase